MCVGKNVLVIDDCEDNLLLVRFILEPLGFKVSSASNGEEGISKINHAPPDLIILDLMMPDISGLEVIRRLKSNCNLPDIPTMLLTANTSLKPEDAIAADELFYKPFDIDHLLLKVDSLLSHKAD